MLVVLHSVLFEMLLKPGSVCVCVCVCVWDGGVRGGGSSRNFIYIIIGEVSPVTLH